jgi:hypothetical protein
MDTLRDTAARKPERKRRILGNFSFTSVKTLVLITVFGVLAGTQIASPKKRVIEAIVGLVLVTVLWNFSTFAGLSLLILMYPFPFGTSIGSSNFILIIVIFILYLIRVAAKVDTIHGDKNYNFPIALLILSYLFSFYNFDVTAFKIRMGFQHSMNFFAAVIFFYMIINFINSEKRLNYTVMIMMATTAFVIAFTIFELFFPGRTIVPGWLMTIRWKRLVLKNVRLGGPFVDFELLGEFVAMKAPLIFYMLLRSRRLLYKTLFVILLVGDLFVLLSTMTRGAFISLSIGLIYFIIISRKDLNIVRLTIILGTLTLVVVVMEGFIAKYTVSGSMFKRLIGTTFSRGIIPDTRSEAWFIAWRRAMRYPILGHSPGGWDFSKKYEFWSHSGYLYYLNITGFFGLLSFLFFLYRIFRATLPGIKSSLLTGSFAEGLMKVLHVCLLIFIIDQSKIEYLRNLNYVFFVWLFFGVIAATSSIIRQQERERAHTSPS